MKPAPPVTTHLIARGAYPQGADVLELASAWLARKPRRGGPAPLSRHGPGRRTTLVGLGAVRDPRERGRCSRARATSLSRDSIAPVAYGGHRFGCRIAQFLCRYDAILAQGNRPP